MVGDASGLEREILVDNKDITYKFFKDGYLQYNSVEFEGKTYYATEVGNKEKYNFEITVRDESPLNYLRSSRRFKIFYLEKDHSDSDKMFAENAGMKYIDIEEFLKN